MGHDQVVEITRQHNSRCFLTREALKNWSQRLRDVKYCLEYIRVHNGQVPLRDFIWKKGMKQIQNTTKEINESEEKAKALDEEKVQLVGKHPILLEEKLNLLVEYNRCGIAIFEHEAKLKEWMKELDTAKITLAMVNHKRRKIKATIKALSTRDQEKVAQEKIPLDSESLSDAQKKALPSRSSETEYF